MEKSRDDDGEQGVTIMQAVATFLLLQKEISQGEQGLGCNRFCVANGGYEELTLDKTY